MRASARSPEGLVRLAVGAILIALLLPAAATADRPLPAPHFQVRNRSLHLFLRLESGNGWKGFVTTAGHRQVTLALGKGHAAVEVKTTGKVTRRGITASFGDLGEISGRFDGRSVQLGSDAPGRECKGRDPVFETGKFRGTIRFRGENGFTEIDSKAVPAAVERRFRRICRVATPKNANEPSFGDVFSELLGPARLTVLRATGHAGGANVTFEAGALDFRPVLGPEFPPSYYFSAVSRQREEGVRITRSVNTEAEEGSFLASGRGAASPSATVTPPQPFTETAQYRKQKGSPASWVGPLAVRLPGTGPIELTPGFHASLCHATFASLEKSDCLTRRDQIVPTASLGGAPQSLGSGQRLPVPGLLGSQALLVEIAAKLR